MLAVHLDQRDREAVGGLTAQGPAAAQRREVGYQADRAQLIDQANQLGNGRAATDDQRQTALGQQLLGLAQPFEHEGMGAV